MAAKLEKDIVAKIGRHESAYQYQRSDLTDCAKYCTVCYISHISKIMLKITRHKLELYIGKGDSRCSSYLEQETGNKRH